MWNFILDWEISLISFEENKGEWFFEGIEFLEIGKVELFMGYFFVILFYLCNGDIFWGYLIIFYEKEWMILYYLRGWEKRDVDWGCLF